jgi:phenylacetate-coenzyme A ligase PaaK-like adenylate-forming protein
MVAPAMTTTPFAHRTSLSETVRHHVRRSNPMGAGMRRSLARSERAEPEAMLRAQERRLRAMVRWAAARSPFYRDWFARSGVRPGDIRRLDDLERLPLLERGHLQEAGRFLTYPRRLTWPVHSSGSSGQPVTAFRTPGSAIYELAMLERQWSWFGVAPGARRAVLRGSTFATERPGAVTMLNRGSRELLVSSFHLVPEHGPEILDALRAFRPELIEGWPSSVALLAGLLLDEGRTLPVRAVATSSEVLTEAQRARIEPAFQAPVADRYGQAERVAIAGECERGGYHVWSEYGIVELLPVQGAPDRREIVGTPLHNWGFPLFRYRTGDQVLLGPTGVCPCGRAHPLLGRIEGRVEDILRARDGRPIPLASRLLNELVGVRESQLVQERPGVFAVLLVPGRGFDATRTQAQLRAGIERLMGPGQELTVTTTEAIVRSATGKARPVRVLAGDPG